MADMTVVEATKLKGEMEQKIADAIAEFVNTTGLVVKSLDVRVDGAYVRAEVGQCVFWQPVPRPKIEAPPKPAEWVTEEIRVERVGVTSRDLVWLSVNAPRESRNARFVFERPKREGE